MNSRVRINVGGQVFETTRATVEAGGPDCILWPMLDEAWSRSGNSASDAHLNVVPEIFVDRDPVLFRSLLNLLRTRHFDPPPGTRLETILAEADYFGLLEALKRAWEPPAVNATSIQQVATLNHLARPPSPSTCLTAGADGSVCVAYGRQLSTYDWTLHLQQSIATELPQIDCIHPLSPTRIILGGCASSDLLPIYDISSGTKLESVSCNGSHAVVRAITCSDRYCFVASLRKTLGVEWGVGKAVAVLDKGTLRSAGGEGAAPLTTHRLGGPDKLEWLGGQGVLMVVRRYEFCHLAKGEEGTYIRLWDPRSNTLVWDWREGGEATRENACCDAIAVPNEPYLMKLTPGTVSGGGVVSLFDLRMLSGTEIDTSQTEGSRSRGIDSVQRAEGEEMWTPVGGEMTARHVDRKEKKHHFKAQLLGIPSSAQTLVSRGANVEVWTLPLGSQATRAEGNVIIEDNGNNLTRGTPPPPFQRSDLGVPSDRKWIRSMATGGGRLFITRDGSGSIEVWETRGKARFPSHLLNI